MSCITLATAQEQLALWLAASKKVAKNQSYTIKDRTITRANAKEIRQQIDYWSGLCNRLKNGGGPRTRRVIPRDI